MLSVSRIILFVVLIISIFFPNFSHAKNFKWSEKQVNINNTGTFYFDKSSVKKIDNFIYYWSLGDFTKPLEGSDIKSTISYHRVDCTDNGYQILIFIAFDDKMGRGNIIFHDAENPDKIEDKQYDTRDSIAYLRHKTLCK